MDSVELYRRVKFLNVDLEDICAVEMYFGIRFVRTLFYGRMKIIWRRYASKKKQQASVNAEKIADRFSYEATSFCVSKDAVLRGERLATA